MYSRETLAKIASGKAIYVTQYAATAKKMKRMGWKGKSYSTAAFMKCSPKNFKDKLIIFDGNSPCYPNFAEYIDKNGLDIFFA